jgi:hypothetical protein
MPLVPKKRGLIPKKSTLVPKKRGLLPKKAAIIAAASNMPMKNHARQDSHLHRMIGYYLKTFNNIISSRINRAVSKFRCLRINPNEMKEELNAKFQMKFSRAIIDRSIQLWRVTDKSMNLYIQTMVDRLITDEVRARSKEQSYCKDLHMLMENTDVILDDVGNNPVPMGWLSMNRFSDAESDMLTQELWERVLANLEQYEPEKLPLLRKILDTSSEVSFSSPSVHALKVTIKAILEDLR